MRVEKLCASSTKKRDAYLTLLYFREAMIVGLISLIRIKLLPQALLR